MSHSLCVHLANSMAQPLCAINETEKAQLLCVDCAATKLGSLLADGVSPRTLARIISFNKCQHPHMTQGGAVDYSGRCSRCFHGVIGYLSTVASFALFGEDRRIGLRLLKLIQLLARRNGRIDDALFEWTVQPDH